MADSFISYSNYDAVKTEQIEKELQKKYTVWRDKKKLLAGQIWWDEIIQAIADCKVFIFLLSKESWNSRYCRAELREAERLQKPIIIVRIRNMAKIPNKLAHIHICDMVDIVNKANMVPLLKSIDAMLLLPAESPKHYRKTMNPDKLLIIRISSLLFSVLATVIILGIFTSFFVKLNDNEAGTPTPIIMVGNSTLMPTNQATSTAVIIVPTVTPDPLPIPQSDTKISVPSTNYMGQRVPAFYIDAHEVTVGAFSEFHEHFYHQFSSEAISRLRPILTLDGTLPMHNVRYEEAKAYCEWMEGSLPTRAQWLIASSYDPATGDVAFNQGMNVGNIGGLIGRLVDVKRFDPNPLGLYDMLGNVGEWVLRESDGYYYIMGGDYFSDRNQDIDQFTRQVFDPLATNVRQTGFRCAYVNLD